jgi:hypothetical protein
MGRERKPRIPKAIRAQGAGPLRVLQSEQSGLGLDGKLFTGATVSHRRSLAQPVGQMSSLEKIPQESQLIVPETPAVIHKNDELEERALTLEEGMPMFALWYDPVTGEVIIPRSIELAEKMFLGRLPMSLELDIDKSCLERGKRGGTAIKRIGKSQFGAFTIALYPTTDEEGNDVDIPFLADMRYKSRQQREAMDRFMKATSSLYYYSRLPRASAIRH